MRVRESVAAAFRAVEDPAEGAAAAGRVAAAGATAGEGAALGAPTSVTALARYQCCVEEFQKGRRVRELRRKVRGAIKSSSKALEMRTVDPLYEIL